MNPERARLECDDPETGALLVSYALGTLSDTEAGRFECHLLHCPACQQELEQAATALETLAASREQFVERAHLEKEDFESQFKQLARARRDTPRTVRSKRSGSWIELTWLALWSRKWIIGTAGVAVIAALFALRHGPEPVTPRRVEMEAPRLSAPPTAKIMGSTSDAPLTSDDRLAKMKAESGPNDSPVPAQPELVEERSVINPTSRQTLSPSTELPMAANGPRAAPPLSIADEIAPSQEALSMQTTAEAQSIDVSSKSLRMGADSTRSADFRLIADLVLGTFRPEQFMDLRPRGDHASEVPSPSSERITENKSYGLTAGEADVADTLFASRRYAEARDQYEQRWNADSTNVRLQVMVGVTSLAQGDCERARTALQLAYVQLPNGKQRNNVGMLLARADLMAGRLDEAKDRLMQLAQEEGDSSRKANAQSAITRIDSLESLRVRNSIPK